AEGLKEVMMTVSGITQEATLVERQTNRYWSLEYLRRQPNVAWQAVLLMWLREDINLGLILIEDLGLQLPMSFKRYVTLGEPLLLKVGHADPLKDIIQFQELNPQEAQIGAN
ncbi:MAG: RNB domain-containing ribonuclease, partial [Nostocaceae cyanobacterium]|nr:RNB domain-containing ribonuclease [Nostocaceae cyanobacterium]